MQIKPCPFCGADAKVSEGYSDDKSRVKFYSVGCSNYHCLVDPMTSYEADVDISIANWNKRV